MFALLPAIRVVGARTEPPVLIGATGGLTVGDGIDVALASLYLRLKKQVLFASADMLYGQVGHGVFLSLQTCEGGFHFALGLALAVERLQIDGGVWGLGVKLKATTDTHKLKTLRHFGRLDLEAFVPFVVNDDAAVVSIAHGIGHKKGLTPFFGHL